MKPLDILAWVAAISISVVIASIALMFVIYIIKYTFARWKDIGK